jgi:molybdopterin-guanine dinucleotide biosynthesis protein A
LIERLGDLTDDILVIGRRSATPTVAASLRVVKDRAPGCGPLGGLDTALAHARYDTVVLVACDMPYVTSPLLAHLGALIHPPGETAMDAVVPRTQRGYHPLCAAYRRACHDAVIGRLAAGQLRMRGLLEDLRVRDVSRDELMEFGDPDRLLTNVNTAQDYDALLRHRL